MTEAPGKPRIFYGYYLVAVTFILLALFNGCGVFVFSLFVKPLEASLGWGRGQVMAGFTVFYAIVGIASPLVGRFVDRHGARIVIPIGACIMYHGGLDWAHFGQSLKPIARQFGLAFLAIFLSFLGYFLLNVVRALDPEVHKGIIVPAGITIPLALLDALAFCVIWRVCMINRDTPEEDSDDLF